jgi:hypothetical protein
MADPLFELLKGRRTNKRLPFRQTRRDELARVPYEQREGSGGGGHADLLKMLKGAYEFTPAADVGDVGTAIQDPSLMNVGIAGLAMLGGPPGDFAKKLLKAKKAAAAKKVYQGSPATFKAEPGAPLGRLKDEFIGTGEGAAAYGRGHYVAEEPDVGRFYRDSLVEDTDMRIGGKPIYEGVYKRLEDTANKLPPDKSGPVYDKMSAIEDLMADGDITALRERAKLGSYSPETVKYIEKELAPKFTRKGNVYEMALKASDEDMLNFDLPLDQQSKKIKNALKDLPAEPLKFPMALPDGGKVYDHGGGSYFLKMGTSRFPLNKTEVERLIGKEKTGARIYSDLVNRFDGDAKKASDFLNKEGIKGIKYADQGSRDIGKKTHNYVVFDPKGLEILRVLGLAGMAVGGAGAMGSALGKQEQTAL